jgi:purine-binding chemotaxis protein CheW
VIIVLTVKNEVTNTSQTMGIVADGVSNTYDIDAKDIKPSPDLGDQVNTSYISGLVAIDDKMMMILDIDFLSRVEALA